MNGTSLREILDRRPDREGARVVRRIWEARGYETAVRSADRTCTSKREGGPTTARLAVEVREAASSRRFAPVET